MKRSADEILDSMQQHGQQLYVSAYKGILYQIVVQQAINAGFLKDDKLAQMSEAALRQNWPTIIDRGEESMAQDAVVEFRTEMRRFLAS